MGLLNEGFLYQVMIDPFLNRMHNIVASKVKKSQTVIDIACGNGTLSLKMTANGTAVTGVDISEEALRYARKRAGNAVSFLYKDATEGLGEFSDHSFDVATISMALHQFAPQEAKEILEEMKRISKMIIILDYAYPLPADISGTIVRCIERMAGGDHHRNFKQYMKGEGLPGLLKRVGLDQCEATLSSSKVFLVAELNT